MDTDTAAMSAAFAAAADNLISAWLVVWDSVTLDMWARVRCLVRWNPYNGETPTPIE